MNTAHALILVAKWLVAVNDVCCGTSAPTMPLEQAPVKTAWWRDTTLLAPALSGLFLVAGLALSWSDFYAVRTILFWAALLFGAMTFVPDTLRRLFTAQLGVGLLMTIAATGAVVLGHVGEAATLAFLFSLAEALETRAMDHAKAGLRALLSLIPETARVSTPQGVQTVSADKIRKRDLLLVGAGERLATDGTVTQGVSNIDTSAVTGESIPVEVAVGDRVAAGSINQRGSLLIEAVADGRDNSLTQIVSLVEQAHARKGKQARLADRIARPLVPTALIVSALIVVFGFIVGDPATWIERALVVLVAASPCALAIAVPVTVISSIGSASKLGIVIKSGQAFEELGTIRIVAFDKTGTLTAGKPRVVETVTNTNFSENEVLESAAAVERSSTHPLAIAIAEAASPAILATGVEEEAGYGVTGLVANRRVRVGSPRWINPQALSDDAERMTALGITVVVVEVDGTVAGILGVRDELRAEASETITMLHDLGIRTLMLTGDNTRTAQALALQAGIDDFRAEQLPEEKASTIEELAQTLPTAMVGDGINDAPALATANVGIAMGISGSAAAIESADAAFTGHDLRLIPLALAHARRGRRIMMANIGMALAIIIVLFPLALFGVLGLAGVVIVHEVAEVFVILNGIRAAKHPQHIGDS